MRRDELERGTLTLRKSDAVSALMVTFGRSLAMGEDAIRLLGLGGLVHDLGKTALSVDLSRKPGQLTVQELAIIREAVLDICLYHHEKFDGSGHQKQLVGRDIPFVARVAAICDVYDALTTVRPYKGRMSQAEAVDLMFRSHGHFDPDLLKTFVSRMIINGAID